MPMPRGRMEKFVGATIAIAFALFALFPVVWTLLTSLKTEHDIISRTFRLLPNPATLENYVAIWTQSNLPDLMRNSAVVTSFTVLICVGAGTLAAYAESGRILAAETQSMLRHMVKTGQTGTTEGLSGLRAVLSAKTLKERFELQQAFSRTAAIWAISEASNFARSGVDMVEKVSAPLAARASLAAHSLDSATA